MGPCTVPIPKRDMVRVSRETETVTDREREGWRDGRYCRMM